MTGNIKPLKDLQDESTRLTVIRRLFSDYPKKLFQPENVFYRLRKSPSDPTQPSEYDTAPEEKSGTQRLSNAEYPALYASEDITVCIHECRLSAEDEIYVATLVPTRSLNMLDLTALITEKGVTEFDSLDLAIHLLFLAGKHSYPITRDIAKQAAQEGYDGIVYPSYFSLLYHGERSLLTTYGLSHRRIPYFQQIEEKKSASNVVVFGRPIAEKTLEVNCINRLVIGQVTYDYCFGPVDY
ncbi:MAG: RES family NAD+ phosphorylase [Candidatus Aegiribacteria sp.]|nr:RES family NAD+ phosphorylase [Candidatus Aegiribacteria sp.]